MSKALNNVFKLDGIRSVVESALSDITGVTDSLAGFNAIAAIVEAGGQVYVPKGIWQLSGTPSTRVTWVIDAGATFTGAGTLTLPGAFTGAGRIVKFGRAHPDFNGSMGSKIGAQQNWLEPIRNNTEKNSELVVLSPNGLISILGGSRTSDSPHLGAMGCIGLTGWAINDNTNPEHIQSAYAGYFEARRSAGAGITQGVEIDVVNFGTTVPQYPTTPNSNGITEGLRIASGGEAAGATIASGAISIINNGAQFSSGITFQNNSLDTSTTEGRAIQLSEKHALIWYSDAGFFTARIRSDATASSVSIIFSNDAVSFQTLAGANLLTLTTAGSIGTQLATTPSYANDAAALAGGVPIGTLYRNGSTVQVRVT